LDEVRKVLIAENEAKKVEAERLAAERAAEKERLLQIKIAESLQSFESNIVSLGKYDAEVESFSSIRFGVPIIEKKQTTFSSGFVLKWDASTINDRYEFIYNLEFNS
jgi:hypothetical protein